MRTNTDDFRGQVNLFKKLADNASDADLFEILNALKMHNEYGSFDDDQPLFQAAQRVAQQELETRRSFHA